MAGIKSIWYYDNTYVCKHLTSVMQDELYDVIKAKKMLQNINYDIL